MRGLASILCLSLVGLIAGCGGGSDETTSIPEPTVSPGAPPTTTPTTPKKDKGKKGKPTTPAPAPSPLAAETQCGTILFKPQGKNVPISALNLPCAKAQAYAKKFVSGELPSQENLPPGWKIGECTGILDAPATPGEPNSPRCTHGNQAFTIHLPQ
jgi:hypothetical protein